MYYINLYANKLNEKTILELNNKFEVLDYYGELSISFSEKNKETLFEIISRDVDISLETFYDGYSKIYYVIIENSKYKIISSNDAVSNEILEHINKLSDKKYSSVNEYLLINHNSLPSLTINANEITKSIIDYVIKENRVYLLTSALTRKFYLDGKYIKNEKDLKEKLSEFPKPLINLILLEEYSGEVNNGGHDQYFNNSSVYGYKMLLDALLEMKIYEYKTILEAAIGVFKPTLSREINCKELSNSRQKFFESLDLIFYSIDISKAEKQYLSKNKKKIINSK